MSRSTSAPVITGDTLMDARGRAIRLRNLDAVAMMRVLRACPDNDRAALRLCSRLARVAAVGDREYPIPRRAETLVAVARALGPEGLLAITQHFAETSNSATAIEGLAADDAAVR